MFFWTAFEKTLVLGIPFSEKKQFCFGPLFGKMFFGPLFKKVFLSAKNQWKKPSQTTGQQRLQLAKKPSEVLQKIDSNFKTTTKKMEAFLANRNFLPTAIFWPIVIFGQASFWPSVISGKLITLPNREFWPTVILAKRHLWQTVTFAQP